MTEKAPTDARPGRAESQIMLNKSNPSLLRSDMSENKDTIHIALHVTKSFAKNLNSGTVLNYVTLNFCQSIPHTDMLYKAGAAATILTVFEHQQPLLKWKY